jgi:hypothetical protein
MKGTCLLLLLALAAEAACDRRPLDPRDDNRFAPTPAAVLSIASPDEDEDPSPLHARNGSLFVAWFSERDGNSDVYITFTDMGSQWAAPLRVTTSPHGDFYPTLFQDQNGTFHLTWFRWEAFFRGHIWYNSSPDGKTWNPNSEVQVTTLNGVDDWVPTPVFAPNGDLLVYFVSEQRDSANHTNQIYVARKRPDAASFEPALPAAQLNSATEHDHLPVAARAGSRVHIVWVRFDTSQAIPWLNPKSTLYHATSADGLNWDAPSAITNDAGSVVNLFPGLYTNDDGNLSLVWLSTRLGSPKVFESPAPDFSQPPFALGDLAGLPAGYSHRIVTTPTPDIYLAVWTDGPTGAQDVYYRFFKR